jgi:AraC-like DNA-binding protein
VLKEQIPRQLSYVNRLQARMIKRRFAVLSIEDEDVASALRFIEHATNGIQVRDVIANARRSPSRLERRIKAALGRTIKAEITMTRLHRAKLLLQETGLAVGAVATRSGFSESKYFCEVFRQNEQMTPTTY